MKLVEKKEFATITIDSDNKIFIVYITSFASLELNICLFCGTHIVLLKAAETSIRVFAKYVDFTDILFQDFGVKLSLLIKIYNHPSNIVDSQ